MLLSSHLQQKQGFLKGLPERERGRSDHIIHTSLMESSKRLPGQPCFVLPLPQVRCQEVFVIFVIVVIIIIIIITHLPLSRCTNSHQ
jgi:hypothetical protein